MKKKIMTIEFNNIDKLDEFNFFKIIDKKYKENKMDTFITTTGTAKIDGLFTPTAKTIIGNNELFGKYFNDVCISKPFDTKITLADDCVINYLCDNNVSDVLKRVKKEKLKRKYEEDQKRHLEKEALKKCFKNVNINEEKRTICIVWKDGTKTVVRCQKDDVFDPFIGMCIAIAKHSLNNEKYFKDILNDLINEALEE